MRAALDATFATDWALGATGGGAAVDGKVDSWWSAEDKQAILELDLGSQCSFDRLLLEEAIEEGQRVERFVLEAWHGAEWKAVVSGGCIGYRRLERFGQIAAQRVRLRIEDARGPAHIRRFGLFCSVGTSA